MKSDLISQEDIQEVSTIAERVYRMVDTIKARTPDYDFTVVDQTVGKLKVGIKALKDTSEATDDELGTLMGYCGVVNNILVNIAVQYEDRQDKTMH